MTPLRQRMIRDLTVRGLADNTQLAYLRAVTGLARHYRRSPDKINAQEVQDYIVYLHEKRHLSPRTCNLARHGLRFFYKITLGLAEPHFYLPGAKQPSTLPQILSRKELVRLLTVASHPKQRALLMTTYAAGLRVSEVTKLKLTDIDSERMTLRIEQGKGQKDRYVPLSPRLLEQLREYWRRERPDPWLFPGRYRDRPMTHKRAYQIYIDAKEKAGITKPGGIHTLRHCFATDLLEAGVGLHVIQRLLGHSSIRSTLRYVHVADVQTTATTSPLELLELPDLHRR